LHSASYVISFGGANSVVFSISHHVIQSAHLKRKKTTAPKCSRSSRRWRVQKRRPQ